MALMAQCCSNACLEDYRAVINLCNSFSLCCFAMRMLYGLLFSQLPEQITSRSLRVISSGSSGMSWYRDPALKSLRSMRTCYLQAFVHVSRCFCNSWLQNCIKIIITGEKNKEKKNLYCFFSVREEEGRKYPHQHIKDLHFSLFLLQLHHLPILLSTKEHQLSFQPGWELWHQAQQAK